MGQYKHLSLEEREDIMVSRSHGKSIGEIARLIGRSKSTVSREVKRNSSGSVGKDAPIVVNGYSLCVSILSSGPHICPS